MMGAPSIDQMSWAQGRNDTLSIHDILHGMKEPSEPFDFSASLNVVRDLVTSGAEEKESLYARCKDYLATFAAAARDGRRLCRASGGDPAEFDSGGCACSWKMSAFFFLGIRAPCA